MKSFTIIILLLFLYSGTAYSQLIINEVQTSNVGTLADEDGEYEDWIELFNKGNAAVNLQQYGLSDDESDKFKWRFPSASIEPKGYMLVFASGKNRKPVVNHWETAVFAQDEWSYFTGTQNPPQNWNQPGFNASTWLKGPGGIGYGDNDDRTIIQPVISVFMRCEFSVADTREISSALLSMDYDDGFVAYLNGIEIARANMLGVPPRYDENSITDHEATMYWGGSPEHFAIDSTKIKSVLVNGTNILAVEIHNTNATSSDLTAIPFLSFGIRNATSYFRTVPSWFPIIVSNNLHANFKLKHSGEAVLLTAPSGTIIDKFDIPYSDLDHSFSRIPDGAASWCVTRFVTPLLSNNSALCYQGYTGSPSMSLAPGFYTTAQNVSLKSSGPGNEIRYTIDGSTPTIDDPLYSVPITINSTTVLKARCFGPTGYLPGKVATSTYVIDNLNYKFPMVSISMEPSDLWDYYTGIYVTGPNAQAELPYYGANYWQPWEKNCHIEYFSPMGPKQFSFDAGIDIHGGWTRTLPQKSFNIKTHSYYDSSEFKYKLFGDKPITEFKSIVLRNAGNDWMTTHMRDAFMQGIMKNTFVDFSAYCPSVVYLNGQYWGIYNIRERTNTDFVEENHGIPADSIDAIENDGIVTKGSNQAFWQMVNYITANDISIDQNYKVASSMLNIPNYADYFIAETYYVNNDWIGQWTNNIKLWRQQKPGSKWNYVLWDTDFGLGQTSNYDENKLADVLYPLVKTPHADIFRKLLENKDFKRYFVNRYADLINTVYIPEIMNYRLQKMQDSIANEIPRAWKRWFGVSDSQQWLNNLNSMKTFISLRPEYARDYINSTLNLQGKVQLKLSAVPAGSGEIKINTIIPGPLPWTGTYFNGNPVSITAIAKAGYKFLYWSTNSYIVADTNRNITFNPDHFDTFTAVFSGTSQTATATISEINYHSDSTRNAGDWIEVYNYGSTALDISDWRITGTHFYNNYVFPTGTILAGYGHIVVAEDTSLFKTQHPQILCFGPLGFGLSNKKETISLLDMHADAVVSLTYYDSVPWLETADGNGRTLELRSGSTNPADPQNWFAGCIGGSPGESYKPCDDQLVFSEINYNSAAFSDAGDWVELFNPSGKDLDVSGWGFSDSEDQHLFIIPQETVIKAGEYLILYGEKAKFESIFPLLTNKVGPFGFGLSGSGEVIRMFDNTGKLQFSVGYDDEETWPKQPDGQGYTLELADVNGNMCDGSNWFAGCPGGSPGEKYSYPCLTGVNETTDNSFTVFPNPATTQVFVSQNSNVAGIADIQINDALGRTVLHTQISFNGKPAQQLSLEGISNGIYFLKITTAGYQQGKTIRFGIAK